MRVHVDYHVEIARHRYSVPHALVGQALDARITAHAVELLHRGRRVAVHGRSQRVGGYTTVEAHMPAAHRAHLQWTPRRLIDWGLAVGPGTGAFVKELLGRYKHPEHGYRACLGLLSLDRRHGRTRLEAACTLALTLGAYQLSRVTQFSPVGGAAEFPTCLLKEAQMEVLLDRNEGMISGGKMTPETDVLSKDRWEAVRRLHDEQVSISEIARRLDIDRKTVRKMLRSDWKPYERPASENTLLRAHVDFLAQRAEQVNYSARILHQELVRHHGYTGSYETVKRYVAPLRARAADPG